MNCLNFLFLKIRSLIGPLSPARLCARSFQKEQTIDWFAFEESRIEVLVKEHRERERIRLLNEFLLFKQTFGETWPKGYPVGLKIHEDLHEDLAEGVLLLHLANTATVKGFHY